MWQLAVRCRLQPIRVTVIILKFISRRQPQDVNLNVLEKAGVKCKSASVMNID